MIWPWGVMAGLALLWPDRVSSPLDGIPLAGAQEAILIGVVIPVLWWLRSSFLTTRLARITILALLAWKVFTASTLTQEGWCVRVSPGRPYVRDATGAPHAWDLRADWRAPDPVCSAVMTRSYTRLSEFPVWFFNLPPIGDAKLVAEDRPPGATTSMTVQGFLQARDSGLLQIDKGPDIVATMRIDGGLETEEARLGPGTHAVNIVAELTGDRWQFSPTWNGKPIWSQTMPTVRRPGPLDAVVRRWAWWIPQALVLTLIGAWVVSLARHVADPVLIGWAAAASTTLAWLVLSQHADEARWAIAGLTAAAALPIAARNRNLSGAFLAIGVPWLSYVVARSAPAIGRFTLYEWGDDFWTFQRYAYRIVLQGYWLEGGSPTFWFQPLYRWIAGGLHVVFGDSSVGEWYWDAACLLAGALFTFRIVRRFASFRWGLGAAALPLAAFVLGTPRDLIGRGLGEISSAGFLYLAALLAMRSRHRSMRAAIGAGVCASLAFFTRLNNLPMAVGIAAFTMPLGIAWRDALRVSVWRKRVAWDMAATVVCCLLLAAALFAARTWYYTGVFSVFHGTQRDFLAMWPAGTPLQTALRRMAESVLMVLTVNDPPRFDVYALPVLGGAAVCFLTVVGTPGMRRLPMALVLFFFASIAGALVARGSAYPGRFSIHVIPVTCAALACALSALVRPRVVPRRAANTAYPVP